MDLPEVSMSVTPHPHEPFPVMNRSAIKDCQVNLELLAPSPARRMIAELMIHCNGMMATLAARNKIPIPFRNMPSILRQDASEGADDLLLRAQSGQSTLYDRWLLLSELSGGVTEAICRPHAMLGLEGYARSTSPLRRYSDLLCHWQIKSLFQDSPCVPFGTSEIIHLSKLISNREKEAQRSMRRSLSFWGMKWLQDRNQSFQVFCTHSDRGKVLKYGLDIQFEEDRSLTPGTILEMQVKNGLAYRIKGSH